MNRELCLWRIAVGALVTIWPVLSWALPRFDAVRAEYVPSDTVLLSREGEELQRLRTHHDVRRGQWVALADVSPALRHALILSEDRRFYAHSGIDWASVSAAAWGNLWHRRTRGASTITMQLAGLLDSDTQQKTSGRSVVEKLGQALAAQQLERYWRKDEILEAYLNLVPFRGEIVGLDALSRTLFAKAAHGLDARESAIAAALVRAPNAKAQTVAQRACQVLQAMQPDADCPALAALTQAALQRRAYPASEGVAPHFTRQWLRHALKSTHNGHNSHNGQNSRNNRSSLSAPLQRFALETLTQHLRELRGRHVEDGAIVVLDNASGEVLAWVGSSGTLSQAAEVDAVLAARQPGSTLKPFLYAQAIAQQRLTAASLMDDAPTQIATVGGLYIPQNYDRQFKGWISVRTALAASLNVPAVRALVMVSPDAFFTQLQALGLGLRESGGYFGYSLALGSSEVTLLALTNAYRALAHNGRISAVSYRPSATSPLFTQVVDARAAFIVGDMLSDPMARARTFGTDSVLTTRFWSAVKTGTSKDMRDNWAVGWSSRYTVGVWVGNASGSPMHSVSGSSGAAPIWASIMAFLHRHSTSTAPKAPAGLIQHRVRFGPDASGQPLEAPRYEWFIAGTEQPLFAIDGAAPRTDWMRSTPSTAAATSVATARTTQTAQSVAHISQPASGSIIALDPDIAPAHQRLQFVAVPSNAADTHHVLRWRIDGHERGRGLRWGWLPWPGRHRVELVDVRGQVLDSIDIEVRGASPKTQGTPPKG